MTVELVVLFEVFVGAAILNLAVIKDNYPVSVADSTDSMSDDYDSPVSHLGLQRVLDELLCIWVYTTGGLI